MKRTRIPVWLITGYLGSGKTTLLAKWLRHPTLADAALIINEIGEVGFDDRVLAQSLDSTSTLMANQCVCCSGLPGLREALADLWWMRLRRERPYFGSVVVETTGLADPRPLIEAFESDPLLHERYVLQAVITAVSAPAGKRLVEAHDEARSQIAEADVIIITKVDAAPAEPLFESIRALNPRASVMASSQASVEWQDVVPCAPTADEAPLRPTPAHVSDHAHDHGHGVGSGSDHTGAHVHGAESRFLPYAETVSLEAWPQWLGPLLAPGLQRLKGVVRVDDQALVSVQWAEGDASPQFTPFAGDPPPLGLTSIRSVPAVN